MKSKKLIELLLEIDPTGETEVCVGNNDILSVYPEPAYYDGPLQILVKDENNPYYNVIGAKITQSGSKINLNTESIRESLFENPELPVEHINCNKWIEERTNEWRLEAKKLREECEEFSKKFKETHKK